MTAEHTPALTAWLDEARVRELIAAMDDEARATEILAFVGERRRRHLHELKTIYAALEEARSELAEMRTQRDDSYREIEHLRNAVAQLHHEVAVLREERLPKGPLARSIQQVIVAGRAATRAWR